MKHSIKNQFAMIFIGLITGTIVLCWFLNTTLLQKYYIHNKKNVLLEAYNSINASFNSGDTESEEFEMEIQRIRGRYNIDFLIINADSEPVTSSVHDTNALLKTLLDRVFGIEYEFYMHEQEDSAYGQTKRQTDESQKERENIEEDMRNIVLVSTEQYTIENNMDYRTKSRYIQMWGCLDNGNPFIIRSALAGIQDSVKISNQFLAYIGIVMVLISGMIAWVVSNQITKPIQQLAVLSQRMTNLDFDAKYWGKSKNEIGVLGEHMNQMSDTLERTISELKTANNELRRDIERKEKTDEMRKDFLSNVSHELKTPLALIMGYAEGLKENISEDPQGSEFYCDVIMDEAGKMNNMVKQLMTLNQLEFGNDVVSMERFDIATMIKNYLTNAQILIDGAGATVFFDSTTPVYVWGDEFKVEEVFMNFFTNALNHVQNEKEIRISIVSKENVARISVFNTGNPIPTESLALLWDKFYKVDKARTREYGGSGVGLSIVKAIMESMNQKYGVENKENGVEFWFELELK